MVASDRKGRAARNAEGVTKKQQFQLWCTVDLQSADRDFIGFR